MRSLVKLVVNTGLLSLLSVMPLAAQVGTGLKFITSFPFYVGKTELPPGAYTLTQPEDLYPRMVLLRSDDSKHTAAILVNPTQSMQIQRQSLVIFEKFGDNLHFDRAVVAGDNMGVEAVPTKAEAREKETASVVEERSILAHGQ